jgi:hypothetical protein
MARMTLGKLSCGTAIILVLALMSKGATGEVAATASAPSWIDVTSDAVQTFYQKGVPHTDWAGNVRLTYEPSSSFFPIGIYYPMPCHVGQGFTWPAFEGDPAWDGTYTLIVNRGHTRNVDDPEQIIARRNAGTGLWGIVINLPASTDLYYSVWPTGVPQTVAEGPFTSRPCPPDGPDDPNFAETISQAGFNLALVWDPWVSVALKEAAPSASQLKLVIVSPADEAFRESVFEEFKGDASSGHADVFGWYIADEPDFCFSSTQCQERLDNVRSFYEEHEGETSQVFFLTAGPGFTAFDWPWWPEFIQVGDAASHAIYPKFGWPYLPTVRYVADTVSKQTAMVGEAKPSWVVLQGMAEDRLPTPAEMRAMVYTAIVHGATGIWQFLWDSFVARNVGVVGIRPDTPVSYPEAYAPDAAIATPEQIAESEALWNSLDASQGGLHAELKALEPVIFSPTADPSDPYWSYTVSVDKKPNSWSPIRTMLKSVGGEQYLIAVNMDNTEVNARFKFVQGMASVDTMFENGRRIVPLSGAFVDNFRPFEVHVYRFTFGCYEPHARRDYVVNIIDLWGVAQRAAQRVRDNNYDVNDDGAVTMSDAILVARNVGTRCPH